MSALQQKTDHYEYDGDVDADVESRHGLLSNRELKTCVVNHGSRSKTLCWSIVLTLLNLTLFGTTVIMFYKIKPSLSDSVQPINAALLETSVYSPVLNTMELNIVQTSMNGSVWRTLDTPWNGEPDDPVKEAVWDDFDDIRIFPVTREEIVKIGQDPSIAVTLDDAHWHLGKDKYIGGMDIFHQIHCLNYIRKKALNGATTGASVNGTARLHTIHCVDMLMQHLLCTGDTGIITYYWLEGLKAAQPNFSVNRKCIDWRQLVEYRDANALPEELFTSYKTPAGARVMQKGDV